MGARKHGTGGLPVTDEGARRISMDLSSHVDLAVVRVTIHGIDERGRDTTEVLELLPGETTVTSETRWLSIGPGPTPQSIARWTGKPLWAVMCHVRELEARERKGLSSDRQWRQLYAGMRPAIVLPAEIPEWGPNREYSVGDRVRMRVDADAPAEIEGDITGEVEQ